MIVRAALAAFVTVGCSCHEPSVASTSTSPGTPAPSSPGVIPMMGTLHELAGLLASDSVTVDTFVRRFGPIAADHGRGAALDLCCADARFTRVQLWRDVDTDIPSMLALDLVPAA